MPEKGNQETESQHPSHARRRWYRVLLSLLQIETHGYVRVLYLLFRLQYTAFMTSIIHLQDRACPSGEEDRHSAVRDVLRLVLCELECVGVCLVLPSFSFFATLCVRKNANRMMVCVCA